jgi:predicted aspartyl protease
MLVYSYPYNQQDYEPPAPVAEIAVSGPSANLPVTITALLDSGADATMLPLNVLNDAEALFLQTSQMRGVTGHSLVVDLYLVTIEIGRQRIPGIQAIAMRHDNEAVLGRDVLNQLEVMLNGLAYVTEIHRSTAND